MTKSTFRRDEGFISGAEPGQPPRFVFRQLYYITHVDNVLSIMKNGVLSHEQIIGREVDYVPIYNQDIVNRRKEIQTPDNESLWHYANFYLQPRNPMLYQVKSLLKGTKDIAIVAGRRTPAYKTKGAFITDGNAAHGSTTFYPISKKDEAFKVLKSVDGLEYWKSEDGTKRMIMAEILVPEEYSPEHLETIYVSNNENKEILEQRMRDAGGRQLPVIAEPRIFFEPEYEFKLTKNLSLVRGDMFFSFMQTLTVSVNTEGVMGKGLASRAKYQFPDVYVHYQDACRSKKLRLGHPVIYKREGSLDFELADVPNQLDSLNNNTWFLLFATKDKWRLPANKEGIKAGLEWLLKNYKSEGIKSLAIPALGCGLGWLTWKEMGPVLCRALAQLDIPVQLFLPAEREIPPEQMTRSYLLGEEGTNLFNY